MKGVPRFLPAVLQFSLGLSPNPETDTVFGSKCRRSRAFRIPGYLTAETLAAFTPGVETRQHFLLMFFHLAILYFALLGPANVGRKIPTASNCSPAPFLPRLAALTPLKGSVQCRWLVNLFPG